MRYATADPQGKEHAALGEAQTKAVDGHCLHLFGLVLKAALALLGVEAAGRERKKER